MTVTPTGYQRTTFDELRARVQTRLRALLDKPNLDLGDPSTFIGSLYLPALEELASLDEVLEIVANVHDPRRSTGQSYGAVALLRGVQRKPATRGTHPGVEMAFSAPVPGNIVRGSIRFHPEGQPSNVWINSNDQTIGDAGTFLLAAESELPGADKILPKDAPITILSGPEQLTAIAVPSDAKAGTDLEKEAAWRARSERAISSEQPRLGRYLEETIDAVISARVLEFPGQIRVIVDDGGGNVADNDIAQAIYDGKIEGTTTIGALSGTAIDADGFPIVIRFDRVEVVRAYCDVTVRAPEGASVTAIREAIRGQQARIAGERLVWSRLFSAAHSVEGVTEVLQLTIGTTPAPTGSVSLIASATQRHDLALEDISVTVVT